MAVSGTTVFTLTRDEIIDASARVTGYLGEGETLSVAARTARSQALNLLVKNWARKGLALWVTTEVEIPLVPGVYSYRISPTSGYLHSVVASGGSGYSAGGTWVAAGGNGTGTDASGTYTVSDGVINAMTILVPGDSYTTVPTSFTPSGAGVGATFTAEIRDVTANKPLKLLESTFVRDLNGNDIDLRPLARSDYNLRSPKGTAGIPVDFYYDPGRDVGTLYLINVPDTTGYVLHAQVQRHFFDMVSGTDNFDFPAEWLLPLKWGLAAEMSLEDGCSLDKIDYIERRAQANVDAVFDFSVEEASTYFTVDTAGMR
jgi:hypothetical protein